MSENLFFDFREWKRSGTSLPYPEWVAIQIENSIMFA